MLGNGVGLSLPLTCKGSSKSSSGRSVNAVAWILTWLVDCMRYDLGWPSSRHGFFVLVPGTWYSIMAWSNDGHARAYFLARSPASLLD